MGYHIVKGVSKRCIARLLLTIEVNSNEMDYYADRSVISRLAFLLY